MGDASYLATSFLGGEIGAFAQGRYDRQDYRTCLNVCLNMHPIEAGTLTRRPGSRFAGTTRGGLPGRLIKFDFEAAAAYMLEFTDGFLRYRSGTRWASTNDSVGITSISTANPAVLTTAAATAWVTGNTIILQGGVDPVLQNRQFIVTGGGTSFTLADAVTGAPVNGMGLAAASGATASRIQETVTPYVGGSWSDVRSIQAETTAFLVEPKTPPQALTVTTLPSPGVDAQFALAPAVFNDGPYLDPPTNGATLNPSGPVGKPVLTLSFPAYVATTAYAKGAFVSSGGSNYESLVDQNITAPPSPSWLQVDGSQAVNGGQGFLPSDIGRSIRLLSEPNAWVQGATYAVDDIVSYNPNNIPGGATYWTCKAASGAGAKPPGSDLTHWALTPGSAIQWTWGKIIAIGTAIGSGTSTAFGNETGGGGVAAAFDGVPSKNGIACAAFGNNVVAVKGYVARIGYSPVQAVASATVYPANDVGFGHSGLGPVTNVVVNLRGKNGTPTSSSDGTLLGTTGNIPNATSPVTIVSTDQVSTWSSLFIETIVTFASGNLSNTVFTAQVLFTPPAGGGGGGGAQSVTVQLLGQPLLYTTPITNWRLGVFSHTTGYPTCGCYHEGRLWLGGVEPNRFDASVAGGIVDGTVNWAPTDQFGQVTPASGISETLTSDGVNPILWMMADQQGVIMGTLAGEFLISPPTPGSISPTNIAGRRVTRIGCANIEPRRTEHTIIFVQRYGRKLMEYFADVYSGKFTAPNLAQWAMHLTTPDIAELAYQQAVVPIIWFRTGDGELRGITYKRDTLATSQGPTYAGFHRHDLGSGRIITSIAVGPSIGGELDALYMVTTDGTVCHVEVLTDLIEEGATLFDAAYLDDAVAPSSVSQAPPSVGAGADNSYVADDGATDFVADDGSTEFVF